MRPSINRFALGKLAIGIGLALPVSAFAAPGYWTNSGGEVWRTGFGQCWHTTRWTPADATAACDPKAMPKPAPVAKTQPAPQQPAPQPAPKPAPKPKMITLNQTASGKASMGFDKYAVTPAQEKLLDSQLKGIRNAQVKSINVTGYTDRIGPHAYNMKLSQKRADAVANYIKGHFNVASDKIHAVGLGPADPVVQCKGVRGAALIRCLAPNRRVTVQANLVTTRMVPASSQ